VAPSRASDFCSAGRFLLCFPAGGSAAEVAAQPGLPRRPTGATCRSMMVAQGSPCLVSSSLRARGCPCPKLPSGREPREGMPKPAPFRWGRVSHQLPLHLRGGGHGLSPAKVPIHLPGSRQLRWCCSQTELNQPAALQAAICTTEMNSNMYGNVDTV